MAAHRSVSDATYDELFRKLKNEQSHVAFCEMTLCTPPACQYVQYMFSATGLFSICVCQRKSRTNAPRPPGRSRNDPNALRQLILTNHTLHPFSMPVCSVQQLRSHFALANANQERMHHAHLEGHGMTPMH